MHQHVHNPHINSPGNTLKPNNPGHRSTISIATYSPVMSPIKRLDWNSTLVQQLGRSQGLGLVRAGSRQRADEIPALLGRGLVIAPSDCIRPKRYLADVPRVYTVATIRPLCAARLCDGKIDRVCEIYRIGLRDDRDMEPATSGLLELTFLK